MTTGFRFERLDGPGARLALGRLSLIASIGAVMLA
jgi:hypothetical protein